MINPEDFLVMFTKGMRFRENFQLIQGVPPDAELIGLAADPLRHGIMLVVQSSQYDPVPAGKIPPIQLVEIDLTKPEKEEAKASS
jgi:hypothetical protein